MELQFNCSSDKVGANLVCLPARDITDDFFAGFENFLIQSPMLSGVIFFWQF